MLSHALYMCPGLLLICPFLVCLPARTACLCPEALFLACHCHWYLQVNTSSVVLKKLMEGREGGLVGSADVASR